MNCEMCEEAHERKKQSHRDCIGFAACTANLIVHLYVATWRVFKNAFFSGQLLVICAQLDENLETMNLEIPKGGSCFWTVYDLNFKVILKLNGLIDPHSSREGSRMGRGNDRGNGGIWARAEAIKQSTTVNNKPINVNGRLNEWTETPTN